MFLLLHFCYNKCSESDFSRFSTAFPFEIGEFLEDSPLFLHILDMWVSSSVPTAMQTLPIYMVKGGPLMRRVTIKDIARMAGVSVTTVSRALNDAPEINPETRKEIVQRVQEFTRINNLILDVDYYGES